MADVDLIPGDYANAQRVRRRVRLFYIAFAAVVIAIGVARLALSVAMSVEKRNIADLEKVGQLSTQSKAQADSYRQQTLLAEKQLAELDELRGRDRLKLLLQAIDAAYSDGIWLDQLRFFRSGQAPTGNMSSLPGGARSGIIVVPTQNVPVPGAPAAAAIEQRVELVGHALNHTRLAEFMRSLSSQPGITDVRLQDTGLGSYSNTPVIDLTLNLLVDDKAGKSK